MRKTLWAIAVVAALVMIWFYVDWRRNQREAADVSALTSEINKASDDIDKSLAVKLPADAGFFELSWYLAQITAINKRTGELTPLMRDHILKAKGDTQFQEAVSNYTKKVQLVGPKLNEVQKRVDEIAGKKS